MNTLEFLWSIEELRSFIIKSIVMIIVIFVSLFVIHFVKVILGQRSKFMLFEVFDIKKNLI